MCLIGLKGLQIHDLGWERERAGFVVFRNFVVSVRTSFFFLWMLGKGCIVLLWHALGLPYKCLGMCSRNSITVLISIALNHIPLYLSWPAIEQINIQSCLFLFY